MSRAERVIKFVHQLKVTSGAHAGRPFRLRPWQQDIVRTWYATGADGRRRVRTGLLSMGRKNGKTTFIAALALAHLIGPEREPRGQVVAAASDRDQSALIFNELVAFAEQAVFADVRINVQRHAKIVEDLDTGSTFIAVSRDAKKAHGASPSVLILDELGQWGTGTGRLLYDALTTATGARAEPLTITISTQSADDSSVMSELVDYGQQVADGLIDDPTFAPFIYRVPEDADPFDEALWPLANPALGDFRSLDEMRTFAARARRIPTSLGAFKNLYLNQRVAAEVRWISLADWSACAGTVDLDALAGSPCYGALDLSSVRDLTSFALLFPRRGEIAVWTWCPSDALAQREIEDRVPYRTWSEQGYLEPTPGRAIDKRRVALRLAEINARFKPIAIAADPWQLAELERILGEEGITLPLRPHGQGYKTMSPATKAFEARVMNRTLIHGSNPLLTWAVANTVLERDAAGNIKPSKFRSRERIDPAVAAIMATGLAAQEPAPRKYNFSRPMAITA